jgi:hypothetical protein
MYNFLAKMFFYLFCNYGRGSGGLELVLVLPCGLASTVVGFTEMMLR